MKLSFVCLVLVICVASTQVEGFRFSRNFGTGFKKIIKDGIRFIFGRRYRPTPVRTVPNAVVIGKKPEFLKPIVDPVMLTKPPVMLTKSPVIESPMKRTIIAIKQETSYGQYLYVRGGGPDGKPIAIKHRIAPEDQDSFYAATSQGDNKLDWGSNEQTQGRYQDRITPQGTPMMWTTNDEEYDSQVGKDGAGYYNLNVQAGHYWIVDLDMNCSQTTDGWFEFKGYLTWDGQIPVENGWENKFETDFCNTKTGPQRFAKADPVAKNHFGKCGEFNLVHFEDKTCIIHSLSDIEQWAEEFHGDKSAVEH